MWYESTMKKKIQKKEFTTLDISQLADSQVVVKKFKDALKEIFSICSPLFVFCGLEYIFFVNLNQCFNM